MTRIFLTGDRSMNRFSAVMVAAQLYPDLEEYFSDVNLGSIVTGDLSGFEAGVRYLYPDMEVLPSVRSTDGTVDLDERHARAKDRGLDYVIFVHPDPLDSKIYKSLVKYWGDNELKVVPLG